MTVLVLLVLVLALVGVGAMLAALLLSARSDRASLYAREDRLNTIWHSLQAVNRINAAFWNARETMRQDAERRYYINQEAETDQEV